MGKKDLIHFVLKSHVLWEGFRFEPVNPLVFGVTPQSTSDRWAGRRAGLECTSVVTKKSSARFSLSSGRPVGGEGGGGGGDRASGRAGDGG